MAQLCRISPDPRRASVLSKGSRTGPALFDAQGLHGIEARGSPGGQGAGEHGDGEKQGTDGEEDDGVVGLSAVEHGVDEPHGGCAAGETGDEAEERGTQAVKEDKAEDLRALRAESDADA